MNENGTHSGSRRHRTALWIGAGCVAALACIVARTLWAMAGMALTMGPESLVQWWLFLMPLVSAAVAWWACLAWGTATGLWSEGQPLFPRCRWASLGLAVAVLAAMWALNWLLAAESLWVVRWHEQNDGAWPGMEAPPEAFPEDGGGLTPAVQSVNIDVGAGLPRGDAEASRAAWTVLGAADAEDEAGYLDDTRADPDWSAAEEPGEE